MLSDSYFAASGQITLLDLFVELFSVFILMRFLLVVYRSQLACSDHDHENVRLSPHKILHNVIKKMFILNGPLQLGFVLVFILFFFFFISTTV